MATLSAASRLREQALNVPGTVLLVSAGHPDKVVRFNRVPELINTYRKAKEADKGIILPTHTVLNLDTGPDQECWRNTMREANQMARRDKPMPLPESVSLDCHSDWALGPEDVPVIELSAIEAVSVPAPREVISTKVEVPVAETAVKIDKRTKAYKESQKVKEA